MKKTQVKTLRLLSRTFAIGESCKPARKPVADYLTNLRRSFAVSVALGLVMGGALSVFTAAPVQAAACANPPTDLGTLTLTVNVPAAGTYTVWSRIMAPDATNNSINLQVDSAECFDVGGGTAISANAWTWVNYHGGTTSNKVSTNLTAGNHTLKYIGTKAGVSLDKIIVTSDASCTPTDLGTNCQPGDSTPPTVSIVSPTNNQAVTGPVTINATASDASGIKDVKFLVDGQAVNTDTSDPYSYIWDSTTASNGSHKLTAQATDNANNTKTSAEITVTVSGGTGTKQGDLNKDGKVNVTDLSILLSNWGKTTFSPPEADINGDGKVNVTDLSILLSRWG